MAFHFNGWDRIVGDDYALSKYQDLVQYQIIEDRVRGYSVMYGYTFANRYCENETNMKVIQEILRHKDIATTMDVYVEATKDAKIKSFTNLQGKIKIS